MKNLSIYLEPKNDEKLEWNANTGRYQLTMAYVKTLTDEIQIKNDSVLQRSIKQTSTRVYQWIIAHSNTANRQVIDFLLNHTEEGRKFLVEVLTAQMESELDWATNDLLVRPVVNVSNGYEGNRDLFMRNGISIECEQLIDDSVHYFGINLTYMQPLPWFYFNLVRQYEGKL